MVKQDAIYKTRNAYKNNNYSTTKQLKAKWK